MELELIKTYKIKYQYIILSWLILIVYLIAFSLGAFTRLDQAVYQWLQTFASEQVTSVMIAITFLGSTMGVVIICMICLVTHIKKGLFISFNIAIIALLNQVIKFIVARERPIVIHLVKETSYSFPSAHAMVSMALFGMIAYFLWKQHKVIAALILIIPIIIGITRIYLGVHFTSDVIAGFLFSITYLCTVIPILKYHKILPIS